jgi:hypothetical protein
VSIDRPVASSAGDDNDTVPGGAVHAAATVVKLHTGPDVSPFASFATIFQ